MLQICQQNTKYPLHMNKGTAEIDICVTFCLAVICAEFENENSLKKSNPLKGEPHKAL